MIDRERIANLKICIGPDDGIHKIKICWFGHVRSLDFRVGLEDTALLDGHSNFTALHIHFAAESQGQFRAGQNLTDHVCGGDVSDRYISPDPPIPVVWPSPGQV